jgi:apolipoprotein D and lipocalin family protein
MRRLAAAAVLAAGCASAPKTPLPVVEKVDLPRFMGDWYVIANIPASLEEGAHNSVESYRLAADGTVETTFTFRKGSLDGPLAVYTPSGRVEDQSGARWGMRFFWWWPFRLEYLVAWVNEDYTQTVIGRTARDYVWIMARTPEIPEADYQRLVALVGEWGYDLSKLQRVPQRWGVPPDLSPDRREPRG